MSTEFLKILSEIIGWIYTALWSSANGPQIRLNWQRKSVAGYSVTFQVLNTLGFTCYSIYTFFGFFYQRSHDMTHSIVIQDLIFAGITTTLVYIVTFQCILYRKTMTDQVHLFFRVVMIVIITLGIYNVCLSIAGRLEWFSKSQSATAFSTLQFFGYCKSFISFIKYVPQVYLNYTQKNTRGFAIPNVLLDMGGGLCSFLQMVINAYIDKKPNGSPDFSNITSNIPKFILSVESMVFCIIFILQHYVIYRANNKRIEEEEKNMVKYDEHASLLEQDTLTINTYSNID